MSALVGVTEMKLLRGVVVRRGLPRTAVQARAQIVEAASCTVLRAGTDQRFEPPLPEWVEAQDVVVIGQVEIGQRDRSRRTRRQILDPTTESISEPPEPAAAHRRARVRVLAEDRERVQEGERVGVG